VTCNEVYVVVLFINTVIAHLLAAYFSLQNVHESFARTPWPWGSSQHSPDP